MQNIKPGILLAFSLAAVAQVVGMSLLPLTRGFTVILPTIFCVLFVAGSVAILARIQLSGGQLSVLIPALAATVPFMIVIVGVVIYKEPAPLPKMVLLLAACAIVGVASRL